MSNISGAARGQRTLMLGMWRLMGRNAETNSKMQRHMAAGEEAGAACARGAVGTIGARATTAARATFAAMSTEVCRERISYRLFLSLRE